MRSKEILIAVFAVLVLALAAFLLFSSPGANPAPPASFTTLDGKTLRLAELRGRPVLVTFWATTCPGCVSEMPHLIELYKDLHPRGLEIIGVAMAYDPPAQVREMVARRSVNYPIALDSDGSIAKAFGDVRLTPTHFVIDPQGRIVQQKLGELDFTALRTRLEPMLKGGA
jgi:peroxiredoxin